jgi:hypothetical protein
VGPATDGHWSTHRRPIDGTGTGEKAQKAKRAIFHRQTATQRPFLSIGFPAIINPRQQGPPCIVGEKK